MKKKRRRTKNKKKIVVEIKESHFKFSVYGGVCEGPT
jgi:hypothetical protein